MAMRRLVHAAPVCVLMVIGMVAVPGTRHAMSVNAVGLRTDHALLVLVAISDLAAGSALKDVTASLVSRTAPTDTVLVGSLDPGESRTVMLSGPRDLQRPAVSVDYVSNTVPESLEVSVDSVATQDGSPFSASLMSAVIALIAGVLGVLLGHVLTVRREEARWRFEWSKSLSEEHRGHYLRFLEAWGGAASAALLEKEYRRLWVSAPVPQALARWYEQTMAILSDPAMDAATKQASCKQLRSAVERSMATPMSMS